MLDRDHTGKTAAEDHDAVADGRRLCRTRTPGKPQPAQKEGNAQPHPCPLEQVGDQRRKVARRRLRLPLRSLPQDTGQPDQGKQEPPGCWGCYSVRCVWCVR
jgi:hypothetical protein